jgi:hypothetical protein
MVFFSSFSQWIFLCTLSVQLWGVLPHHPSHQWHQLSNLKRKRKISGPTVTGKRTTKRREDHGPLPPGPHALPPRWHGRGHKPGAQNACNAEEEDPAAFNNNMTSVTFLAARQRSAFESYSNHSTTIVPLSHEPALMRSQATRAQAGGRSSARLVDVGGEVGD